MNWAALQVARVAGVFGAVAILGLVATGIDVVVLGGDGSTALANGLALLLAALIWAGAVTFLRRRGAEEELHRAHGDVRRADAAGRARIERQAASVEREGGCVQCGQVFPTVRLALDHVARAHDDGDLTPEELALLVVAITPDDEVSEGSAPHPSRRRRPSFRTSVATILGLAILACAVWIAGEQHYQSCVETAAAKHPVDSGPDEDFGGLGGWGGLDSNAGLALEAEQAQRRNAIAACSRWPI